MPLPRLISSTDIVTGDGAVAFNTRTLAAAATLPSTAQSVRTAGYAATGDGGGALYKRAASEPSHDGKFQSADGTWWEYVPGPNGADIRAFGALGSGANDTLALRRCSDFITANNGGAIYIPPETFLWGLQSLAGTTGLGYAYLHTTPFSFDGVTGAIAIHAAGATLKNVAGLKYGAFNPTTGAAASTTAGTINPDQRAQIGCAFEFRNCTKVSVFGYPDLHGNITTATLGGCYSADPADTTGIQLDHDGIVFVGCDQVYAEIGSADYFGRDGCQVGYAGLTEASAEKPHVLNFRRAQYNGRQGLSYIGGNSLTINDFDFSHTGKSVVASNPGAGIDVEAESSICRGLVLNNPFIFNNRGPGIVDATGDNADVTINGGKIVGTTTFSLWVVKPGWKINGTTVVGQVAHLYGDATDRKKSTKVIGGSWSMNTADSPSGVVYAATDGWQFIDGPAEFDRVSFDAAASNLPYSVSAQGVRYTNCTFKQTSTTTFSTQGIFDGLNVFDVNASAPWNIIGALTNLGTIRYNNNLYARKEVSLALVNGANNNVAIPTPISGDDTTYCNVSGPTGVFNITGIAAPANLNTNSKLVLVNASGQTMTLTFGSGSSSFNNQILIGGSADLAISSFGVVELIYSIFRPGWYVAGYKA